VPLLTAIAAMGTLLDVLDPMVWFQWLRTMGSTYVIGALCFYAALFLEYVVVGRCSRRCAPSSTCRC
jgi:hypothetical protein